MNKRALTVLLSIGLMACPMLLWAQTAASTGGKVGVVDIQQAIMDTGAGKQAFERLQKKYKPREAEIDQRQQEVQQLQDQLQKQMTTLSAAEQRSMNHELQMKKTVLRRLEEDAQSSFQYDRNTIMQDLGRKMVKVIDKYAAAHGYSLVIDGGQVPVYYTAKGVNITPQIVRLYDSTYPVQSASAGGSGTSSGKSAAGNTTAKAGTVKH